MSLFVALKLETSGKEFNKWKWQIILTQSQSETSYLLEFEKRHIMAFAQPESYFTVRTKQLLAVEFLSIPFHSRSCLSVVSSGAFVYIHLFNFFPHLVRLHRPDFSFAFGSVAYSDGPWVDHSWAKLVSLLGLICVQAMKAVTVWRCVYCPLWERTFSWLWRCKIYITFFFFFFMEMFSFGSFEHTINLCFLVEMYCHTFIHILVLLTQLLCLSCVFPFPCVGVGGNLVAIQASRISTYLHFWSIPGVLPYKMRQHWPNPCVTFFSSGNTGCTQWHLYT